MVVMLGDQTIHLVVIATLRCVTVVVVFQLATVVHALTSAHDTAAAWRLVMQRQQRERG